jgi:hypothetical protein
MRAEDRRVEATAGDQPHQQVSTSPIVTVTSRIPELLKVKCRHGALEPTVG